MLVLIPETFASALGLSFWLSWLVSIPMGFLHCWVMDKIIRIEYQFYRRQWLNDDSPRGWWFVPAEARGKFYAYRMTLEKLSFAWFFKTPVWMRGDERLIRLVFWHRCVVLMLWICLAGFISPILIGMLL
jgi:hypothetical protein